MYEEKNDPFVKKFVPSDNAEIALHNLNAEYYVFIWELPLASAASIQELAGKLHMNYVKCSVNNHVNQYKYYPPRYRGIYRNPESNAWVISSAWLCGKLKNGGTQPETFDNLIERMNQFKEHADFIEGYTLKLACITTGDNYRNYCKYINGSIEMLELEYAETGRESLLPIRDALHRISDYKPHLKIIGDDDDQ